MEKPNETGYDPSSSLEPVKEVVEDKKLYSASDVTEIAKMAHEEASKNLTPGELQKFNSELIGLIWGNRVERPENIDEFGLDSTQEAETYQESLKSQSAQERSAIINKAVEDFMLRFGSDEDKALSNPDFEKAVFSKDIPLTVRAVTMSIVIEKLKPELEDGKLKKYSRGQLQELGQAQKLARKAYHGLASIADYDLDKALRGGQILTVDRIKRTEAALFARTLLENTNSILSLQERIQAALKYQAITIGELERILDGDDETLFGLKIIDSSDLPSEDHPERAQGELVEKGVYLDRRRVEWIRKILTANPEAILVSNEGGVKADEEGNPEERVTFVIAIAGRADKRLVIVRETPCIIIDQDNNVQVDHQGTYIALESADGLSIEDIATLSRQELRAVEEVVRHYHSKNWEANCSKTLEEKLV